MTTVWGFNQENEYARGRSDAGEWLEMSSHVTHLTCFSGCPCHLTLHRGPGPAPPRRGRPRHWRPSASPASLVVLRSSGHTPSPGPCTSCSFSAGRVLGCAHAPLISSRCLFQVALSGIENFKCRLSHDATVSLWSLCRPTPGTVCIYSLPCFSLSLK